MQGKTGDKATRARQSSSYANVIDRIPSWIAQSDVPLNRDRRSSEGRTTLDVDVLETSELYIPLSAKRNLAIGIR